MFYFWFIVSLFFRLFSPVVDGAATHCQTARECEGLNLTNMNDSIQCSAYFSCGNAGMIETNHAITGTGSYALHNAKSVTASVLYCRGLHACSGITMGQGFRSADCSAESSCSDSVLHFTSSSGTDEINCDGDRACANSTFYMYFAKTMSFRGHAAGYNATFITSSNLTNGSAASFSFYFTARDSGYLASIICGFNHTCTIYCESNACNNLTLTCSDCVATNVVCEESATKSDICPEGLFLYFVFLPFIFIFYFYFVLYVFFFFFLEL